jgi:hypothetical protein
MTENQEIRAKALEIAVLIFKPNKDNNHQWDQHLKQVYDPLVKEIESYIRSAPQAKTS